MVCWIFDQIREELGFNSCQYAGIPRLLRLFFSKVESNPINPDHWCRFGSKGCWFLSGILPEWTRNIFWSIPFEQRLE